MSSRFHSFSLLNNALYCQQHLQPRSSIVRRNTGMAFIWWRVKKQLFAAGFLWSWYCRPGWVQSDLPRVCPHWLQALTIGSLTNSHSMSPEPLLICWQASGNHGFSERLCRMDSQKNSAEWSQWRFLRSRSWLGSGLQAWPRSCEKPTRGSVDARNECPPLGTWGSLGPQQPSYIHLGMRPEANTLKLVEQEDEMSLGPQGSFESYPPLELPYFLISYCIGLEIALRFKSFSAVSPVPCWKYPHTTSQQHLVVLATKGMIWGSNLHQTGDALRTSVTNTPDGGENASEQVESYIMKFPWG